MDSHFLDMNSTKLKKKRDSTHNDSLDNKMIYIDPIFHVSMFQDTC